MTIDQPTLPGLAEGERLRDEAFIGLDEADRGQWETNVIMRAITEVARWGIPFSANDVRPLLPEVNTNRIGRCFALAAQRGLIRSAGRVKSNDPGTHGKKVETWIRNEETR